jgi:hypothetical protein
MSLSIKFKKGQCFATSVGKFAPWRPGTRVESALDTTAYQKGIKVSNAEMKTLDIQGDAFHPEWNYTIRPRSAANRSS